MKCKIAIIGAGSAIFSLNLIKDLCVNRNLTGSKLSLMDINPDRLEAISLLAERYLQETGNYLDIEKTADRRQALKGADFVINVALDYGHSRLRDGWKIAYENGYRFGGSLHIVHDEAFWVNFYQLRLMESILQDVLEICPNAYYIMVANPVQAGITYLSRKYPQAKLIGMCHGYNGVNALSKAMGIDPADTSFEVCGVNHFIWLTKYYYKGEDAFPMLDRWIAEKSKQYLEEVGGKSLGEGPKAIDLYKKFGAFPIGDTCTPGGGSWGWWYHTDGMEEKYAEDPYGWYESYFENSEKKIKKIHDTAFDPTVRVTDVFTDIASNEPMVPLIEALACDIEHIVIVNILNKGSCMPGVPENYEVEIPARVSKKGVQGIQTDGLPTPLMSYLYRDRIASVEMELQAFETGSRDYLIELIRMDPWTKSDEQAQKLLDAILDMPCNREMKEYFSRSITRSESAHLQKRERNPG